MKSTRELMVLLASFLTVILTVAVGTRGVLAKSLADDLAAAAKGTSPAKLVVIDPRDPKAYTKRSDEGRTLVLMGDSHLTCFTGEKRGDFFNCRRDDPSSTHYVADEDSVVLGHFAAEAAGLAGARDWTFARLGFSAARPAELMLVMSKLLYAGRRPDLVVLGLRWSACTQTPLIRPEYLTLLKDPEFAASFRATLKDLGAEPVATMAPPPPHELSQADRLDEALGRRAGIDSDEDEFLRAVVRDGERGVDRLSGLTTFEYSHAACDRQLDYVTLLLRVLEKEGIPRVCYLPPEQPQRIPEYNADVVTSWLEPSVARIRASAETTHCPLIDARAAVAEEHFGWNFIVKDPVHMDQGGHAALAHFLFEEGQRRGFWQPMEAAAVH